MSFDRILEDHSMDFVEEGRDHIYQIGDKLVNTTKKLRPTISYNYLNIGNIPDFCFNHTDIEADDYKIYFQKLKEVSQTTLEDLSNASNRKLDFVLYTHPNKSLMECFKKIVGEKYLQPDQIPTFGRIGLYNSTATCKKAPRIFFFVGHYCTLNVMLFDTFHSIYPEKS